MEAKAESGSASNERGKFLWKQKLEAVMGTASASTLAIHMNVKT